MSLVFIGFFSGGRLQAAWSVNQREGHSDWSAEGGAWKARSTCSLNSQSQRREESCRKSTTDGILEENFNSKDMRLLIPLTFQWDQFQLIDAIQLIPGWCSVWVDWWWSSFSTRVQRSLITECGLIKIRFHLISSACCLLLSICPFVQYCVPLITHLYACCCVCV